MNSLNRFVNVARLHWVNKDGAKVEKRKLTVILDDDGKPVNVTITVQAGASDTAAQVVARFDALPDNRPVAVSMPPRYTTENVTINNIQAYLRRSGGYLRKCDLVNALNAAFKPADTIATDDTKPADDAHTVAVPVGSTTDANATTVIPTADTKPADTKPAGAKRGK